MMLDLRNLKMKLSDPNLQLDVEVKETDLAAGLSEAEARNFVIALYEQHGADVFDAVYSDLKDRLE